MSMMIAAIDTTFDEALDLSDSMVLERRGATRIRISRPVRVIDLSICRHAAGRSRDISATGMRVEIPATNAIQVGDTIHVDVGTLSGAGPLAGRPRVIPGRIVWIQREAKMVRPMLTAGVEFEVDQDAMMNVA